MYPMSASTTPTVMPISATLKTGKSIKVVAIKSVTKPKANRSIALPIAPPATIAMPTTSRWASWGARARYTAIAIMTANASTANAMPCPSPILNAAPILRTNIKSTTPGMTVTCKASPTARTASLVSWSTSSTTSATPPATPNRQRKGGVISPVRPKSIPYPQNNRIPFNAVDNHTLTQARSDKSPKNGNTAGRA